MQMKFRQFVSTKQINNLEVFDYDRTIANSPEKPKNWKGEDWWGSEESIKGTKPTVNKEVVDAFHRAKADPAIKAVLLTGRKGRVAPYVRSILRGQDLVGKRMAPNKEEQNSQIRAGIDFEHPEETSPYSHEEYYNGDFHQEPDYPTRINKKGKEVIDEDTLTHKIYIIRKLVQENGGYDTVTLWDDRASHFDAFMLMGKDLIKAGMVRSFTLNKVIPSINGEKATIVPVQA